MAECRPSVEAQAVNKSLDDDAKGYSGNQIAISGRRPLSDSSISYEENAFNDSPQVKLVNFSERRNSSSILTSSEDGDLDSSDDCSKSTSSSQSANPMKQPFRGFSRKTTKISFDCDCSQSQKAKRKEAKKFSMLSTVANGENYSDESHSHLHVKQGSFMKRVKSLFRDSGSTSSFKERRFHERSVNELQQDRRSKKESVQKKERRFIIGDILAVTNCSYYWGNINRHEAEELLIGKPDGTFLLRDSAHKDHLFSVSFRRYNKTLHARIEQWDHKYSFDHESPMAYFSITIEGLLSHYAIGEYCMFFEPMLVKALIRAQPQPLMSLCRGAIGNCTKYKDIDYLPIPSSLKTYLRQYSYSVKPKTKKDDDGKRKRNSTLCIF